MRNNNIIDAEYIIDKITKLADVSGIDLSTSNIWEEYKDHVKTILTNPSSDNQQDALHELTLGLNLATKGEDRKILSFALATVRRAILAQKRHSTCTENVTIEFPENSNDRFIQVYSALEGIREPFSHEEFHITYTNKDGSKLRISTSVGAVTWIDPNGVVSKKDTNFPYHLIRLLIKYFVNGNCQALEKFEWNRDNPLNNPD